MENRRKNKKDRYQIFLGSTGEFLAQSKDLRQAERMVLANQRIYRYVKLVDSKSRRTLLSVS